MLGLLTTLALWCLVITNNTRGTAACIVVERNALASFNASIIDPGGKLHTWQGENCCSWGGVSCSKKTGHVAKLDLGSYSLKGEISPSLAGLTRLMHLNLSHGDFRAVPIPEFIGSFKMLRYLDLSHAGYGGTTPPQLGNLSRLSYLHLGSFRVPGISLDNFMYMHSHTDTVTLQNQIRMKTGDWIEPSCTLLLKNSYYDNHGHITLFQKWPLTEGGEGSLSYFKFGGVLAGGEGTG